MKTIQEERLGGVFSKRGRNGGDACKIQKQEMGRENAKEFRKRDCQNASV
jgi:hypothetical protein